MALIVILDQDASLRHLLHEVLEEEGYRVVEAQNSYEGLHHDQEAWPAVARAELVYLVAF